MHDLVSFNGQIVAAATAHIGAVSAAALYGKGVFTTLPIYAGQKDGYWYDHWLRLTKDARKVGIDVSSLDGSEIGYEIDELVRRNNVEDGRARVTFFDENLTELWPVGDPGETSVLIMTGDRNPPPDNVRLTRSPFRINSTSPLAGVKSCNYLEKILARNEARSRGFHECVRLNERGEIVSAAMANIFWIRDGRLFTSSLKTGCLPGITRARIIEGVTSGRRHERTGDIEFTEVEARVEELESADEIYLTSCGIGVAQVAEFEGRRLKGEEHYITKMLSRPA